VHDPHALCRAVLHRVDHAVAEAGVADGLAARVPGFPYLRVNRFLASYAHDDPGPREMDAWARRLAALGSQAYRIELGNLAVEEARALAHDIRKVDPRHATPHSAVEACTAQLLAEDLAQREQRAELLRAARVPDDYVTWHRVAGLYWLTRIPFAAGIRVWHEETRAVFGQPVEALPVEGALVRYTPPPGRLTMPEVARIIERASANPLGIPEPGGEELEALYRTFAPVFIVDVAGEADRPGALIWSGDGPPRVDSSSPVVYRRVSHARYGSRALLQLNYAIWFPQRPKEAGWDILGGHLDGVLWRVTLAPDGEPWVYDSIHLCGCYHQFFPTARAAGRPRPATLDETAFVPQTLEKVEPGARLALRLASGTHYLQRVMSATPSAARAIGYGLAEDDALRSQPHPGGGRRSVYRPDGIIAGSERAERYFFWPMGVPEPGAMRQWGRHPTAFVGRRHFDDARLLEGYFELRSP
jgi:hypothetical protein